jgi:toxin ParE1/3/4
VRILRRPQAKIDLIQGPDNMAQNNLDAAMRFLDAAESTFAKLAEAPGIGRLREFANPGFRDVRSCSLSAAREVGQAPPYMSQAAGVR